jgi:5-methylcytosine-specific restriction endonuclease McrA
MDAIFLKCRACLTLKPSTLFKKRNDRKSGVCTICKQCRNAREGRLPKQKFEPLIDGHKRCCSCKEQKALHEFPIDRSNKDGRFAYCRPCVSSRFTKTDSARKNVSVCGARYRAANPEKIALKGWRRRNGPGRDELLKRQRSSEHKRRTQRTQAGGSYSVEEWESLVKKFKGLCVRCGEKKPLTADHIVPVSRGGSSHISNIQPLCKACNCSKGNRISSDYTLMPFTGKFQSVLFG